MKSLFSSIILLFLLSGAHAQNRTDTCNCNEVIKSFKYFEKSYYEKGIYSFYPKTAVAFYADSVSHPPLNKHIQTMLDHTSVELNNHNQYLIYQISENTILQWEEWLKNHCKKQFEKYRKRHTYIND